MEVKADTEDCKSVANDEDEHSNDGFLPSNRINMILSPNLTLAEAGLVSNHSSACYCPTIPKK